MSTYKYLNAIRDPEFPERVKYHMIKAAVAIVNESTETANHAARAILARSVLWGNVNWNVCVQLTVCNWAIEALEDPLTATDTNIGDAVAGFWDALTTPVVVP